jgi:hypothetical protein
LTFFTAGDSRLQGIESHVDFALRTIAGINGLCPRGST